MSERHSPLPWRWSDKHGPALVDANGGVVLDAYGEGVTQNVEVTEVDADFIVTAVNTHAELVEALATVTDHVDAGCCDAAEEAVKRARELLARCKRG